MPSVSKVSRVKSPNPPDEIDARWSALEAMEPAAWAVVAPRVTYCLDCLGPALLTGDELTELIASPRCRRCRAAVAA